MAGLQDRFKAAVEVLIASVMADETDHGGLLSRQTIRHADEVRVLLSGLKARRQAQERAGLEETKGEGS